MVVRDTFPLPWGKKGGRERLIVLREKHNPGREEVKHTIIIPESELMEGKCILT